MSHVTGLCVLRGIRHRHGFAAELLPGSAEQDPAFARALHARAIMSNEIPDISAAEEFPYCIWYPDTASEDTYRQLARRYPQMRYQVGRACAVAGFKDLYSELDLLPDVSIAEEARDSVLRGRSQGGEEDRNINGSQEIFDQIVRQPVRWQVMDDYRSSVDLDSPKPARYGLNGDTAVFSTLELKRDFRKLRLSSRFGIRDNAFLAPPWSVDDELAPCYFNITEDWNVDEYTSCSENSQDSDQLLSEEMEELLWKPLPVDLPWGNKDLLVLMAAYYGDVDRYARLRRPLHVSSAERFCVIRGIYHNTLFAKWCSLQPDTNYASAITARFIMSNDISRITEDTDDRDIPSQIWYPSRAAAETYVELARRKPAARAAVARALIVADYQQAWDSIADGIEPYKELMVEAKASTNPHYLASLRKICADRGLDPDRPGSLGGKYPEDLSVPTSSFAELTTTNLVGSLRVDSVQWDCQGSAIYDNGAFGLCAAEVELFAAAPKELRPSEDYNWVNMARLYDERAGRGQRSRRGEWGQARTRGRGLGRGRGGGGGIGNVQWAEQGDWTSSESW